MNDVTIGLGGFAAGVVVGVLLRSAWDIGRNRKGLLVLNLAQVMLLSASGFRRITGVRSRFVGVGVVVLALLANLLLGFLLIATRADIAESNRDVEETNANLVELAVCVEEFQRDKAVALKARDDAQDVVTSSSILLWESLRASLVAEDAERYDLVRAIDRHIDQLESLENVRTDNPFPAPDRCRGLVEEENPTSTPTPKGSDQ